MTLKATEAGETSELDVTVNVTDVVGPTITGPTELSVKEGTRTATEFLASYTTGGAFDAFDESTDVVAVGADGMKTTGTSGIFTFASGVLSLTATAALDYETTTSYIVTLKVTAPSDDTELKVTVNVENIGPTITGDAEVSVLETEVAAGTVIASYSTGGDATWSVHDDDAGRTVSTNFTIATNGAVSIATGAALVIGDSPYTLIVRASEGTETSELRVTVTVENVGPTINGPSEIVLDVDDEDALAIGAVLAQYTSNEAVTWSVSGTDVVIATNGTLSVGTSPLVASNFPYSLIVMATKVGGVSTNVADVTTLSVMVVSEPSDTTTDDTPTTTTTTTTTSSTTTTTTTAAPAAAPAMPMFSASAPIVTVTEREDSPGQNSLMFQRHDGGASFSVPIGWISSDGQTVIATGFIRDAGLGQTYTIVRRESDGMIVRLWIAPDSPLVYAVPWADVNANYTVPTAVLVVIALDDQNPAPNQLTRRFDGGDDRIFSYDANLGQWRHVPDLGTFQAAGFYWCDVTAADAGFFGRASTGPAHPSSGTAPSADYPSCRTS